MPQGTLGTGCTSSPSSSSAPFLCWTSCWVCCLGKSLLLLPSHSPRHLFPRKRPSKLGFHSPGTDSSSLALGYWSIISNPCTDAQVVHFWGHPVKRFMGTEIHPRLYSLSFTPGTELLPKGSSVLFLKVFSKFSDPQHKTQENSIEF